MKIAMFGHKRIPSREGGVEIVVEELASRMVKTGNDKYDAIYLATEERKTRDLFKKEFPGKILENKRRYYDDIYDKDSSICYYQHNCWTDHALKECLNIQPNLGLIIPVH